ncbi:HAAS signaling domain-containing protein [Microbispora rosea]|uniref:HAAS signaling domain-containing protein n=1 Tax=Microbispora rosea TaxID=58117 RepID=UPI00343C0B87
MTPPTTPPMTPQDYAAAVRAALADLPARDRDALLEDLDEHLAEVAAEPGMSLEERLGGPEAYAAELRAAYGGRPSSGGSSLGGRLRERMSGAVRRAHTRLLVLPPYRQAAVFAPELRPAWWVLRGYAIALAVLAPISAPGLIPGDIPAWVFTLAVVWGSVWLGRRGRARASRWGRVLLLGANLVAAVLVVTAMADVPSTSSRSVAFDYGPRPQAYAPGMRVESVSSLGGDVSNILPYAEDGTPLHNVRLYDQDGNPIMLDPGFDQEIVIPCDGEPPIRNAYPLPLKPVERRADPTEPEATCAPATPAPTDATASPAPFAEQSGSPSPSPSAEPSRRSR